MDKWEKTAKYVRELARDRNGTNFEVPGKAVYWRVRQSRGTRGPGRVVCVDGEPLQIEIDATYEKACDAIEDAGCELVGTYTLVAVDENGEKACDKVAYLEFDEDAAPAPQRNAQSPMGMGPVQVAFPPELAAMLRACSETVTKLADRVIERDKERERELCALLNRAMSCITAENEQLIKSKVRRVVDAEPAPYDEDDEGEEEIVEAAPLPNPMGELFRTLPFLAMMMRGGQGGGPPQINIDHTMLPVLLSMLGPRNGGGAGAGPVDLSALVDLLRSMGVVVNITAPGGGSGAPRNAAPADEGSEGDSSAA